MAAGPAVGVLAGARPTHRARPGTRPAVGAVTIRPARGDRRRSGAGESRRRFAFALSAPISLFRGRAWRTLCVGRCAAALEALAQGRSTPRSESSSNADCGMLRRRAPVWSASTPTRRYFRVAYCGQDLGPPASISTPRGASTPSMRSRTVRGRTSARGRHSGRVVSAPNRVSTLRFRTGESDEHTGH